MLALLVAALGSKAAAAPLVLGAPPWAVEAPGAVEKRFSLGFEVFGERQESLRITAFEQRVSVVDLGSGREDSGRLPGDPELLNRKFDLTFERHAVGPSFAVALPTPSFGGSGRLYPTLTVGSAIADVSLDLDDVTESRDSTSLRGRGALFETRLDLVATLCASCPWFTATGYRFETLPPLAVDRAPRFALPGFTVPRDDVRLGREVHEVSSRVGYAAPGARMASFVGVQHRWTDLEIDDRVTFRNAFAETRLASWTRLESEATLAVAGIDVALAGGFFSRLETAVGSGDASVRLSVAYQPSKDERPPPPPWIEPASINLTLRELLLPLAVLEMSRPDAIEPLLAARGKRLAELLEANGIRLAELGEKTVKADGVRPRVSLVAADEELDLEAQLRQAQGLPDQVLPDQVLPDQVPPDRVSQRVPPMLLMGSRLRAVVVFVSEPQAAGEATGSAFLVARWQGPPPAAAERPEIHYDVNRTQWTASGSLRHILCGNQDNVTGIALKLQFADGRMTPREIPTDSESLDWYAPCPRREFEHLQGFRVPDDALSRAPLPVVVAGALVVDDQQRYSWFISYPLRVVD